MEKQSALVLMNVLSIPVYFNDTASTSGAEAEKIEENLPVPI
jgi:hypothetical protein